MPTDSTSYAPNKASQPAAAYLQTQVLTASPAKLRLLLLDGALRFLQQGRDGLVRKDYSASYEGFSQTRNIIVELISSMRVQEAPELCARVRSLYTFIFQTVVEASLEKDITKADKAIELVQFERETWVLAMEKLASDSAPAASTQPGPGQAGTATRAPVLSVQG
ncbi:MAG: flagellar export chaperone FliS [Phycisphaerales bacterium]|nr:flagellar export chaperone FliS [Phycisphaerales bacterium]